MTRLLALVVLVAGLALAAPAAAQPPIVRPGGPPPSSPIELGRELFAANCSTCHGGNGQGVLTPRPGTTTDLAAGPSLIGVGRLAADFYLRTGYMPLVRADAQPTRERVQFREPEVRALEDYVDSLGGGPAVPQPHPETAKLSTGLELFTEHCAGCHQVAAAGGVVTGARVPPLSSATPVQIAEAVRIGPYAMPTFSRKDISDRQLDAIIAYVQYTDHPDDAGGWGINHLGPFPEGMVTWLMATLVLVGTCILIGERLKRR